MEIGKFYAEYVEHEPEEKDEATIYLTSWKKFFWFMFNIFCIKFSYFH